MLFNTSYTFLGDSVSGTVAYGTTTDIDGNFSLKLNSGASILVVQIVSYEKTQIDLSTVDISKPLLIKLWKLRW